MVTDKLIENASVVVLEYDDVGAATIQRRFALGYVGATQVIDALIARGVLSSVCNKGRWAVIKQPTGAKQ